VNKAKKSTDYVIPTEICVQVNVIFDSKIRSHKLAARLDSTDAVLWLFGIRYTLL
jgi:hypothetical protein